MNIRKVIRIIFWLIIPCLIISIIIAHYIEHTNHKTPAPGYSIVEDGNGNYAAKHNASGHILTPSRMLRNRLSKQTAINWSWMISDSMKESEEYQKKWK